MKTIKVVQKKSQPKYSIPRHRSQKYHKSLERSTGELNARMRSATEDWLSGKISDSDYKVFKSENLKQLDSLLSGHYKK